MTFPEADEPALLSPRRVRARLTWGTIVAVVVTLVFVGAVASAGIWMLLNPQRVTDQITVWQFEPSTAIAAYADRSTMTDEGRFLFFASTPSIESGDDFDEQCASQEEEVGILGCYQPGDKLIYLFDVTDDRLDGIEEVVAAHEMLHAAWDRMSTAERGELTPLLEAEAASRSDDPEFAETLAYYATAEPGQRVNELHSIIGTEFSTVSDALEAHYAEYFTDRGSLVALHEKSNAVFTAQQDAIADIIAQLDSIEASVDTDYATYNAGYDQLNADIADFNRRADNGDFTTQRQFDEERAALLARQGQLDALYATIDARKTQYDDLIVQLDALNATVAELNQSINIKPRSDGDL